nr:MAG TPA_asm: hypothetical protein [Caudoviricetes sp.]
MFLQTKRANFRDLYPIHFDPILPLVSRPFNT